jgi:uncharacterized membrane protein
MGSDLALNPPPPPPIHEQVKALVDYNEELRSTVQRQQEQIRAAERLHEADTALIAQLSRELSEANELVGWQRSRAQQALDEIDA